jgi:lipopolysaccharide transport system ATP-binding protein
MYSDSIIKVCGLSKHFQIYDKPSARLKQIFFRRGRERVHDFTAVEDVTFEIRRGETLGIVGKNGSGKSTLLQLICGTLAPTEGSVEINGRVAALLELGAGFNPEFTGRENVFLSAALYGLRPEEIESRFEQIAEFSEIGSFIDQPVKTYSSGMFVRLAFSVIAHVNADILIIDEALSVGDAYFVQKCMRFLREFMKKGTLLFCSHDTEAIVNLCSKAILMDHGKVLSFDEPKIVVDKYLAALYEGKTIETQEISSTESFPIESESLGDRLYRDMRQDFLNNSSLRNDIEIFKFDEDQSSFGCGGAEVMDVTLNDLNGNLLSWVVGGEDVRLIIRCRAISDIKRAVIGFQFRDRLGQVIFADNTFLTYRESPISAGAGMNIFAVFQFRMPVLPSGDYSISPAIAEGTQESHVQHHWIHDALLVRVHASSICLGLMGVPMQSIQVKKIVI